ncbi:MAG: HAMP domain-containing histidine kinase, partial [Lachnospiraceae bacterium]|nr:HAMP domain-containing histidine kinase [Lachnospiraceae bacterium]
TIIRSLIAFMISTLFFIGTYMFLRHFRLFVTSQEKIEQIRLKETASLQEFIDSNKLDMTDVSRIGDWKPLTKGVRPHIVGTDDEKAFMIGHEERSPGLAEPDKSLNEIVESTQFHFSDGDLWIYIEVDRKTRDRYIALDISLIMALIFYILLYLQMFRSDTEYLLYLMHELTYMSQGELDRDIRIKGDDELGLIGRHINEMRKSISEQVKKEREILEDNGDLVTAVSHDLRTPLTRQIGYLEILHHKKYRDDAQRDEYIEKARNNAFVMKDMTDRIFKYFLVFSHMEKGQMTQVDGKEYINNVLKEQSDYLISRGFKVCVKETDESFFMMVDPEALPRVFDNIFLNLEKYADRKKEIFVVCRPDKENKKIIISFTNTVQIPTVKIDSAGVGLKSVARVMKYHNGEVKIENNGNEFITYLSFNAVFEAGYVKGSE